MDHLKPGSKEKEAFFSKDHQGKANHNGKTCQPNNLTGESRASSKSRLSMTSTKSGVSAKSTKSSKSLDKSLMAFKNVENAKSHLAVVLRKYSTILFLLGMSAAFVAILDSQVTKLRLDIEATKKDKTKADIYLGVEIGCKAVISLLSIATGIYLYFYYVAVFTSGQLKHIYADVGTFLTTPLLFDFIIEFVICVVHIPPGISVAPEAQLIVFARFYLVGRFLKQKHSLMNSKSTRFLASVTKTELSSMFLVKTYFMHSPFLMTIAAYFITVLLGSYLVYMVEADMSYKDTIWMLLVTMTTVGYGDFTPSSYLGRTLVALAAVVGIFLMALCISLVNEYLTLTQREKRILAYADNQDKGRMKKELAAKTIQRWWEYRRFLNSIEIRGSANCCQWIKLRQLRSRLYTTVAKWRVARSPQEDPWRKEFELDNTIMMLTDVTRQIKGLEELIVGMARQDKKKMGSQKEIREDRPNGSLKHINGNHIPPGSTQIHQQVPLQHMPRPRCFHNGERLPMQHHALPPGNNIELRPINPQWAAQPLLTVGDINGNQRPFVAQNIDDINSLLSLVQSQIRIMQSTLDDLHTKSQQDLRDLENVVLSLAALENFCSMQCPQCGRLAELRSSFC